MSFLAAVIYIPYLGAVFRFAALDWPDLMIAVGAGGLAVLCLEIVKFARREPPTLGRRSRLTSSEPSGQCPRWSSLQGGRGGLPDALFILLEATAAARLHSVCTRIVKTITEVERYGARTHADFVPLVSRSGADLPLWFYRARHPRLSCLP